jgi:hypothetical protein
MLTKITDDLHLNLEEIVYISKQGKDIHIKFKDMQRDVVVSVYTKEGKSIQNVLKTQYLMAMRNPNE